MDKEDSRMISPESLIIATLGSSMLVCLLRAVLGPTVFDRLVAVDATNTLVIALLVTLGAVFREIIYVDVAIVYALLSFVSTLYISKYMEEHP
jgi:multicomponent Na+:H+ antiporter subunit F